MQRGQLMINRAAIIHDAHDENSKAGFPPLRYWPRAL
jgi:hypothetical protein